MREGRARTQPFLQLRPPPPTRDVAYRDGDGLFLTDQYDELLAPRNAGIKQVPLQHGVVLRHDGNDNGGILRALGFVDRGGVGRDQRVEFAEAVGDGAPVEARNKLARLGVDAVDLADVAIIDLLVVVVLDLHDLVAGRKGPAEALDFVVAGGVESGL